MLDALIRGPGAALPGIVLLGDTAADGIPARRAAVDLARAWVKTGRRTILADLGFDDPGLHVLLGVANDEGLWDHFAFGTSLARLAIPVDDGAWSLIPAGTFIADPAGLLAAPEWGSVLRECAAADSTLLAYAPADAPGVANLTQSFGAVVLLGSVQQVPGVRPFAVLASFDLPDLPASAEATTQPASTLEPLPAPLEQIALPTDVPEQEALVADLRLRQRAARMTPPADAYQRPSLVDQEAMATGSPGSTQIGAGADSPPTVPLGGETGAGGWEADHRRTVLVGESALQQRRPLVFQQRSHRALWWTLAVVGLAGLLAGGWYYLHTRMEARREAAADAIGALEIPLRLPQPMSGVTAPAADTVLAFAVALGEHVRLPNAEQTLNVLRARVPEGRFFIAPVVRAEALYYTVMAGPVSDSASASALAAAASGTGATGDSVTVQMAPYAFLLGDYASADLAAARVEALRRLEIPSYSVPLAGPPTRYRVYVGGYRGSGDAEVMRQILQSVGEPDLLVLRMGKH